MLQMYWDRELAKSAQNWANLCKYHKSPLRSNNMIGENMYMSMSLKGESDANEMHWNNIIKYWYKQIKHFTKELVDSFTDDYRIEQVSQMIWNKTLVIGCGYAFYRDFGQINKLYVCHYRPPGNTPNQPVYELGPAASNCPNGTRESSRFPGICCQNNFCDEDFYQYNSTNNTSLNQTNNNETNNNSNQNQTNTNNDTQNIANATNNTQNQNQLNSNTTSNNTDQNQQNNNNNSSADNSTQNTSNASINNRNKANKLKNNNNKKK